MSPLEEERKEFTGPAELTGLDRRDFFRYLGLFSSMSLLAQCSKKSQTLVPFVSETEKFSVRNYDYYATALPHDGFAQGVLVKSYQGRPIKIEGNPKHPASIGATTPRAQAALYELFHPDRLRDSPQALEWLKSFTPPSSDGAELGFVFPALHSPTLHTQIRDLQKRWPRSSWVSLSPWKRTEISRFDFSLSGTLLSFDEDLFAEGPLALRNARAFMDVRKRSIQSNLPMSWNQLFVVESHPTHLGSRADETHRIPPSEVWNFALDLLSELEGNPSGNERIRRWLPELKKSGAVAISPRLHPEARALEKKINTYLAHAVEQFSFPLPENTTEMDFLTRLKEKKITTLFVFETDLLHHHPEWREVLSGVKEKIGAFGFPNETSAAMDRILPLHHWAEAWGDLRAPDGTVTIQQPLIEPLGKTLSGIEILDRLAGRSRKDQEIVKAHWKLSEADWKKALRTGVLQGESGVRITSGAEKFEKRTTPRWELVILPDPHLGFGEHADNPLLQELPRPFYRNTWRNAVILGSSEAQELGVKTGHRLELKTKDAKLTGPALVSELLPPKTILIHAGFGKKDGTKISKGRGINPWELQGGEILSVKKVRGREALALVQKNFDPNGEPPVKTALLPYEASPPKLAPPLSLYPDAPITAQEEGPRWAMSIDLSTCIGCEACVSACQVENNIPFVGEDQVKKDRHLHWLRIDHYFKDGVISFQPVPCMHCEKAPCEVVCPVNATVHGDGGLNEMIYNRCVGTRYCSNNCPYKVRRFNFKTYSVLKRPWNLGLNPEVSVRDRGVMEKCTYCVQRIKAHEREGGNLVTACQSVCPTEAIVFGDLRDKDAEVTRSKASPLNYDLLEDEGTRPRTSYLKEVRRKG